jgi:hypothetical protein
MTDNEIKKLNGYESTDEFLFSEDWFAADFISTCRCDGDLAPTHWLKLPPDPDM